MKLFVWRGDGILEAYASGIMFAMADTEEQAKTLLLEAARKNEADFALGDVEYSLARKPPEVFEAPAAFFMYGSS